jgi:hypothetical protein
MGGELAGNEIARDDAARLAVDDDEVEHFGARVHGDLACVHLALEGLIGAEQKLLAGLAASVEGARNLGSAEGAVVEGAAVFAGEGDALSDALVDDVDAVLREAIDVAFASAEVAAFDRVVEEAVDAVAVVLIILSGIDAALRCDGVRAAGRILKAEAFDVVAKLAEGSGRGAASESGADDDEVVASLVGGVNELHLELSVLPGLLDRPGWYFSVQMDWHGYFTRHPFTHPASTATGIEM